MVVGHRHALDKTEISNSGRNIQTQAKLRFAFQRYLLADVH